MLAISALNGLTFSFNRASLNGRLRRVGAGATGRFELFLSAIVDCERLCAANSLVVGVCEVGDA